MDCFFYCPLAAIFLKSSGVGGISQRQSKYSCELHRPSPSVFVSCATCLFIQPSHLWYCLSFPALLRPTASMRVPSATAAKLSFWRRTSTPGTSSVAMWGTWTQGRRWRWPWSMFRNCPWKQMEPCAMCSRLSWILDTVALVSILSFQIPVVGDIIWEAPQGCRGAKECGKGKQN